LISSTKGRELQSVFNVRASGVEVKTGYWRRRVQRLSLEVSKQMGIDGGEFSAAATLGMNKDPRSFREEAIHPSSNPTMIT
jgi:hypothetical protein